MVINILWNKLCGPGGGTRHLHQRIMKIGGEIGSTQVIKIKLSLGYAPPLSVKINSCK